MNLKNWRRTHENIYPVFWGAVAVAITYYFKASFKLELGEAQVSTTTTVASILMGFLGTSYGILLSATTKRIEWAKGRIMIWQAILKFFNESFVANFALCVYSIALSFFVASPYAQQHYIAIFSIWAFLVTWSVVSFFRAMRVLLGLLRSDPTV